MDLFLYTVSIILALGGLIGAVLPIIPGPTLSFAALLLAFFSSKTPIVTPLELGIWAAIVFVVSVLDYYLPVYFTKKMGGSTYGLWGATLGMIGGFIFFPPLGLVFGPIVGAILGELINNKNDVAKAFRIGMASFFAFLFGTCLKLIIGVWVLIVLLQGFYPTFQETFGLESVNFI